MNEKGGNPKQEKAQGEQKKQEQHKPWQKKHQYQHPETKKKDPEEIPILKYGPNNNLLKFKEALSKAALKNYGNLGKLIKQGSYYTPEMPERGDYDLQNDPDGLNKMAYLEDMKEYCKEIKAMEKDQPKLYTLILQYLSKESLEEIKREDDWDNVAEATDPEGLWVYVEKTHKVNTISKVPTVTKMSTRTTYQQMMQGPYESIILYKERFTNALKAYVDQKNPEMGDIDIAMDFFRGLDNGRYAGFKTEILNGLTAAKLITQPVNLNAMYLLANQWVKPVARGSAAGYANTFHTTLDKTDRCGNPPEGGGRQREGKIKGGKQQQITAKTGNNNKKDDIECFACGEIGHYTNKCPHRKKPDESEDEGATRNAHVTWDASTFATY
jgi:hypothetical protein